MGYYFVEFCALYGYGDVLALLGRYFLLTLLRKITVGKTPLWRRQREFLNGLKIRDNLRRFKCEDNFHQRAERLLEWSGQPPRVSQVLLPKVHQSKTTWI